MKYNIRISAYYVLVLAFLTTKLSAQSHTFSNFIGLTPAITIEPYYEKGELDVNIFPLVYQTALSKRVDIRLSPIANLGIRKSGNALSHLGLELAIPIFIKTKENKNEASKGFYCAPLLSASRNTLELENNFGLWIEPGYHLHFNNFFALSLGLQVGATHIRSDSGNQYWGSHFGGKIIFGKWF